MGYIIKRYNHYYSGIKKDILADYTPGMNPVRITFTHDIENAEVLKSKRTADKIAQYVNGTVYQYDPEEPLTSAHAIQLCNRLKLYREFSGLKAQQIADGAKVPKEIIYKLYQRRTNITIESLYKVRRYLDAYFPKK